MNDAPISTRRILLVDPYAGGHHAQYLEQLLRYRPSECSLMVAVTEPLLKESPLLSDAQRERDSAIRILPMENPHLMAGGAPALIRNDLEHGRQVRSLVREYRPDHCLLMYFDRVQVSLAFDLRFDCEVGISGIYFRPTFHYSGLSNENRSPSASMADFGKQVLLRAALRNPHLTHLFSLDPFAASKVNDWGTGVEAVPLPDGAEIRPASLHLSVVRQTWGVDERRHVALLFGVIDSRKGVFEILEALEHLDNSQQEHLCLALVGPQAEHERAAIGKAVARAVDRTAVQLVVDDRFIQQDEIQNILSASDSVMLTYQRHVGSSNVLVHAAAAKKPVIGPEYGLVGAYIRQHRLGFTIDSTDAVQIARALSATISGSMAEAFDPDLAERFASGHSAERFAKVIYDSIAGQVASTSSLSSGA